MPTGKVKDTLVLLVDDVEDNREIYEQLLRAKGYRVASACDGIEALELAHSLRPDLVVLDLGLPRMDGVETLHRLRAEPMTARTPVVVVTGHIMGDLPDRARKAGANAVLGKPCLPNDLLKAVEAALSTRS